MSIEYRYRVVDYDGYVIAKIEGDRKNVVVKTTGTRATRYERRMTIEDWDKLPKSAAAAQVAWISELKRKQESAAAALSRADDDFAEGQRIVSTLEVKDIR